MLFEKNHVNFLKPTPQLYELLVLSEIVKREYVPTESRSMLDLENTMLEAYLSDLAEKGYVELIENNYGKKHCITDAGRQRRRYLLVDYVNELISLHNKAKGIFKERLTEVYLKGIRNVAFYPAGETAELAYSVLNESGLRLTIVVDDDAGKWGMDFHELKIEDPSKIAGVQVDAVIITTCTFQTQVIERLTKMGIDEKHILTL